MFSIQCVLNFISHDDFSHFQSRTQISCWRTAYRESYMNYYGIQTRKRVMSAACL